MRSAVGKTIVVTEPRKPELEITPELVRDVVDGLRRVAWEAGQAKKRGEAIKDYRLRFLQSLADVIDAFEKNPSHWSSDGLREQADMFLGMWGIEKLPIPLSLGWVYDGQEDEKYPLLRCEDCGNEEFGEVVYFHGSIHPMMPAKTMCRDALACRIRQCGMYPHADSV